LILGFTDLIHGFVDIIYVQLLRQPTEGSLQRTPYLGASAASSLMCKRQNNAMVDKKAKKRLTRSKKTSWTGMGNKVSVRHYNKRAQDASASKGACLHGCLVGSHTLLQGKDSLCSSSLIFQHHLLFIDTRDAVVNLLNLLLVCLLALQRHQCSCSQVDISLVT